jgi:hypothetical protein
METLMRLALFGLDSDSRRAHLCHPARVVEFEAKVKRTEKKLSEFLDPPDS